MGVSALHSESLRALVHPDTCHTRLLAPFCTVLDSVLWFLLSFIAGYVIKELQEQCQKKPAAMLAAAGKALR